MAKNVGSVDKFIRLIAGVVLIALPFISGIALFDNATMSIAAVVVGAVFIGTALFSFCPLYRVLGIRTCKV